MVSLGGKLTSYSDVLKRFAREYAAAYGTHPPGPAAPVTVDGLVIAWLTANGYWSDAPIKTWSKPARWRRDNLNKWGSFCESIKAVALEDLKPDNIKRFAAHCHDQGWSPWSVRHYVFAAARAWKWGKKQGYISIDHDEVRLPKGGYSPKDLDPEEVADAFAKIDESKRRRRAGNLFKFCLMVGCRPGEARLLKWGQVRFRQSVVVLESAEHKTGRKTGQTRSIHLTQEAIDLLKSVKPSGAAAGEHVFLSRLGKPYTRDGFASVVRRLGTFPYAARHTWGQNAVDRGVSLDVVGEQMGHNDPKTTRQYARVRSARVLNEISGLVSPVQSALLVQSERASKQKAAKKKPVSRGKKKPNQGTPAKARGRRAG